MAVRVPLTTLLSWTWIAFTIEVDNAVEAASADQLGRSFRTSLPMWTNGLRLIDEDGITVDDLRARARAACNIGGLERWGYISVGDVGDQRREGYGSHRGVKGTTVLRPTRSGVYVRRLWPTVLADVEERWATRFGSETLDSLRSAILPLAGSRTDVMPWSPPEVHPSDGFRTSVVDGDQNPAGERPLVARLGQVLCALTLDIEQGAEVSLPLGADVLRPIADEVVAIRDLPKLAGVSKEAISMALTYLRRWGLTATEPNRSIRLTTGGRRALDDHRVRVARPQDAALRTALEAILAQTQALSAGLTPPTGGWRGNKPYLAQTERLVANPTGALPWHPMVLHRGACPDGS